MRIILLHDEMLNPEHALFSLHPDLPRVFVFDTQQLTRDQFSLRRVQFMADCLAEIEGVQVYQGQTADVLAALGVTAVVTQRTPQLHVSAALAAMQVEWHDEPTFVDFRGKLKRFMHFWKAVEPQLVGVRDEPDSRDAA